MGLGRKMLGLLAGASLFVLGAFSIVACSGSRDRDDDEGDDGGGTGSTSTRCANYCQRDAACPYPTPDCEEGCMASAGLAAELVCSAEFQQLLLCLTTADNACSSTACSAELDRLGACYGVSPGCAPTGTGPANGDCVALCQRSNACPGADQLDCARACADAAAEAAAAGCTLEFNRLNGCGSTCTNVCVITSDDCSSELNAYEDCILL